MTPAAAAGSRPFSRRLLLGGTLAGVLVETGCTTQRPPPPATVQSLTAQRPFYVAHRGGGADWPEMTGYAYQQATRLRGLRALEVSVCQTADGVLVCSHDKTTERVTGVPYVIAEETWETLSRLEVTGRQTNDPGQPARPFTRFDEVVEAYADSFVLFVEPKDRIAATRLMDTMVSSGQPERVVWKQPVNSRLFATAKQQGFSTWGYVVDDQAHTGDNLTRYAASPDIDILGAPRTGSDEFVSTVVAAAETNAKLTIMWEIRSLEERDRALRLGCAGVMAADIAEVLGTPA